MASSLPNNPSLGPAQGRCAPPAARVAAADAEAVADSSSGTTRSPARFRVPKRFALHDAQLTVARRYGFTGWPALVHYLEVAADLTVDPSSRWTRTRWPPPTGSAR